MPQMGEFSLAIAKVGADHNVVGALLYPVIAGTTAVSSFLFPFIMKSSRRISDFLASTSPPKFKQLAGSLEANLASVRRSVAVHGEHAEAVSRASRLAFVNIVIIAMILAVSAVLLHYASDFAGALGWGQAPIRLVIGAVAVTLCVPSGLIVWRAVSDVAERVTAQVLARRLGPIGHERRVAVARVVEQALFAAVIIVALFFSLPLVVDLLSIGSLASPMPIAVLLVTVLITARLAMRIHQALEVAFHRTILGE
jgi:hypothetical protein